VQHPVGAQLPRRQPGQLGPREREALPPLRQQGNAPLALVATEDLLGPVRRAVVDGKHGVDAGSEMEGEDGPDDVGLIPCPHDGNDAHGG